jgi:hypothetical protein
MKKLEWHQLSRTEQCANVLYPHLSDRQGEMSRIAKAEGKRAPHQEPLLTHQQRGAVSPIGGVAKKGT